MLRLLENRRMHVVFGIEKFPNIHAGGYSRYKQIDYGNVFGRYRGVVVVVVSFARVSNARARYLYSRRAYTTAESRRCFYLIFRKKKKTSSICRFNDGPEEQIADEVSNPAFVTKWGDRLPRIRFSYRRLFAV